MAARSFAMAEKKEERMSVSPRSLALMLVLMCCFLLSPAVPAGAAGPVEVKQGDKCAVCGMFAAKYPHWVAQIVFLDGTYAVFDGPKDLFRYYFNFGKYNPSRTHSDISGIYVTEYYSGRLIDARKAFFVAGSDVYGPMGAELVPVEDERNAKEFLKDHKGKKILRFGEITAGELP